MSQVIPKLGVRLAAITSIVVLVAFQPGFAADPVPRANFEKQARVFLKNYCFSCHGEDEPSSEIRLDEFTGLTLADVELWRLVLESVEQGEMPPEDQDQPTDEERAAFVNWLRSSLLMPELAGDPLKALHDPSDGNLVDHKKLFDGSVKGPAWSPPRMWRRSQSQYDALMEELWVVPRLRGDFATHRKEPEFAHFGYSQPFPQMDPEHFTNYSGGVHADEATLKGLLDAGQQIALRLTQDEVKYHELHQPLQQAGYIGKPKGDLAEFYVEPPKRAAAFEPFLGDDADPTQQEQVAAIEHVFALMMNRPPAKDELKRHGEFLASNIEKSGPLAALRGLIINMIVSPEFVFRMEIGMTKPDEHGRRKLAPRELTYALAYALTDGGPDEALMKAAESGELATRADVECEVRRILNDDTIEKLPKLRFWQEFFGYLNAMEVFKDGDKGGQKGAAQYMIRDADQLVSYIMQQDRQVFRKLLTTDRYFVGLPTVGGNKELLTEVIQRGQLQAQERLENAKKKGKGEPDSPLARLIAEGKTVMPGIGQNGKKVQGYVDVYGFDPEAMEWSPEQPMKIPDPRLGMLMHPAWLWAHSTNFDNDVVGRGHWIRERLLAGMMPTIPIGVQAQVPQSETETLRQRMKVTEAEFCWKCHKRMDPLGLPFEEFDHYGHFRTVEKTDSRGRKKQPVDSTGAITFSGDQGLDGPVKDAREMVRRLADSERVRQSIIRHAFRYWMGRNEMLSDSPTLIAADKAYVESDGSFNEMLVSLLTSDSFLYRK